MATVLSYFMVIMQHGYTTNNKFLGIGVCSGSCLTPRSFADTAQKMKFSFTDFFSKCYQILRKLRIWSHLLKKSVYKMSL